MVRFIQGWAQQVIHRAINNDEPLIIAILHMDHLGNQHAIIGHNRPAGLKANGKITIFENGGHHRSIGNEIGGCALVIINANTAPQIERGHRQPFGAQSLTKR